MKQTSRWMIPVAAVFLPLLAHAETSVSGAGRADWHANGLGGALALTALWGVFGVLLAILGYKLFDKCTPGELHREIVENKNVAAAIVGAAVILGVCIVIAAAMLG